MKDGPFWRESRSIPPDRNGDCSDDQQTGSPIQLNHGIPAGDNVEQGFLANDPVTVVFTDHALESMRTRGIDRSEVLHALARGPSSHARRQGDGRYSVATVSAQGRQHGYVRVIYERPSEDDVTVITAYRE